MEARAVELGLYVCHSISGLLQTADHARAACESRQPPYTTDEVERMVAARVVRPCVEVATEPGTVHVRDSKTAEGPRLAFAPDAWAEFVPYAVRG